MMTDLMVLHWGQVDIDIRPCGGKQRGKITRKLKCGVINLNKSRGRLQNALKKAINE